MYELKKVKGPRPFHIINANGQTVFTFKQKDHDTALDTLLKLNRPDDDQ